MLFPLLLVTLATAPVAPHSVVLAAANRAVGSVVLAGRVTDSTGQPIVEARIIVLEANRSTTTDAEGRFRIGGIPEGTYGISIAAIGFRPRVYRITLNGTTTTLEAKLLPSIVELAAIQTTATPVGTSVQEAPQPLSVLQHDALAAAQAPSLGAVLELQPGLRNSSTGNGIGKPVIRGLSSNRVLILDNGQRMETQQWGDEHAPNVETATAERIEVIRGPASVLYGSDALGGVINVVQRELPDAKERGALLRGTASANYATNGRAPDGSLLLEGASGALGFRGTLNGRHQDNVQTPAGALSNSGLSMRGGSGAVGVRGDWGSVMATLSHRAERLEIHEDPAEDPTATPFQRIGSTRLAVNGNLAISGGGRLDIDLGGERNRRREFEASGATDVALGLLSTTGTANIHLHQAIGRVATVLGLAAMHTAFEKSGEETLVPNNSAGTVGVYGFGQVDHGAWQFSGGARYDYRRLTNEADAALKLAAGTRHYSSVTGNLGALYRVNEPIVLVANIGRGFRAPSPFELFSNGVHEGTVRFERGDATLDNETSLNVDVAVRVQSSAVQGELGVFRNAITNYIYPDPTGVDDPTSGFQIYNITQGDAVLSGAEAALEYHPSAWLHLRAGGDYTRGQNTTTNLPLAFVAPLRLTSAVRYEGQGSAAPYLEVGLEHNTRQTRLDPEDTAPAAYTLTSASAGTKLTLGNQTLRLDLQVRNLFDVAYRAFLSRYKTYADDMGRNVSVRVGVDF
jgi:outer membrane receptor protein involved in Fe transport